MEKVLYFSHVNWSWIKQRPHFIPYYIAKSGFEVTYLSLNSISSFITNNKIKMKNTVDEKNLKIIEVNVLPFGSRIKMIGKINHFLVSKIVNESYDTIILTHPNQIDFVSEKMKCKKIIYECMDNHPFFISDKDYRDLLIRKEKKLCLSSNKIVVSSYELKKKLIKRYEIKNSKIDVVPNALDDYSVLEYKEEKISLRKPNLVYIGTVGNWFDLKLIRDFANRNSNYTVYLVGPIDKSMNSQLRDIPSNIVLIGAIEHRDIFKYIINGEIMILPFIVNEVIECVDPVKVYEYMVFNKPIVSSHWNELDKFGDKVRFYKDIQSFDNIVKHVDLNRTEHMINTDFLQRENWKKRVINYLNMISL